jgi:hypothetical protein
LPALAIAAVVVTGGAALGLFGPAIAGLGGLAASLGASPLIAGALSAAGTGATHRRRHRRVPHHRQAQRRVNGATTGFVTGGIAGAAGGLLGGTGGIGGAVTGQAAVRRWRGLFRR